MRLLLVSLAAAVGFAAHAGTADAAAFVRCGGDAGKVGFQCGAVKVPLDRAGAVAGEVALHVRRLRAQGFASKPPLLALAGGPGQGASNFATMFAAVFEEALSDRDLVVVDQRGTGRSGALRCASFETVIADEEALADAMRTCVGSLSTGVGHYRTLDSVEDLDAVRAALGAERIALFGVSYGTKVALGYASRHPTRVERLVLDSVVEPDGPDALWRPTFAAMPRGLREVGGRACPYTRSPAADLAAAGERLDAEPLQADLVGPNGKRASEALSSADLFSLLLTGDFDPWVRAGIPGAVAAAAKGDGAQLLRLLDDIKRFTPNEQPQEFSWPLFYATTCTDSALPWGATETVEQRLASLHAEVEALPVESFAPFGAATALEVGIPSLCLHWAGPAAPPPRLGAVPDVPALVLNGTLDLRTPLADAQALASRLPHARLIEVAGTGHSVVLNGPTCAQRATVAFLNEGATPARPCRTPRFFVPERPAPRSLAAVGGTGRARISAAAQLTLRDVLRRLPLSTGALTGRSFTLRGGGLRGGRYLARPSLLVLHGVEFVPGVTVSGTITGDVDPFGAVERARGTLVVRAGTTTVRVSIPRRLLVG